MGSIPRSGRSLDEEMATPGFLLGKSQGQRSLVGYSTWGRKESGMTEQLNMARHMYVYNLFTLLET